MHGAIDGPYTWLWPGLRLHHPLERLEDRDFADASAQLDRMPDGVFTRYGLTPEDVARPRQEFAAWPRT
jgi:hypothetical protein